MYLLSIFFSIVLVLIFYDFITGKYELFQNIVAVSVIGMALFLVWRIWRRGLFLDADFVDLIQRHGGTVKRRSGILRGHIDDFMIEARLGRYLRGGAPFPSWHGSHTHQRPCGDPECMLCDSRVVIRSRRKGDGRDGKVGQLVEIVGGTWEGRRLSERLEDAVIRTRDNRRR